MPHLTIEYSANLDGRVDLDALCAALLETVLETGLFEIGAVRVRALRADHFSAKYQIQMWFSGSKRCRKQIHINHLVQMSQMPSTVRKSISVA